MESVPSLAPYREHGTYEGTPRYVNAWFHWLRTEFDGIVQVPGSTTCLSKSHSMLVSIPPEKRLAEEHPILRPYIDWDTSPGATARSRVTMLATLTHKLRAGSEEGPQPRFLTWIVVFHILDITHLKKLRSPRPRTPRHLPWTMHANAMVLDRERRTVTRFEPQGLSTLLYSLDSVDAALTAWVDTLPRHRDAPPWTYVAPKCFQAWDGPQMLETIELHRLHQSPLTGGVRLTAPERGTCAVWSLLFIHLQLQFPHLSAPALSEYLQTHPSLKVQLSMTYEHMITAQSDKLETLSLPPCQSPDGDEKVMFYV